MGAFDSKEFKALQREWAGKLRASGFQDIEKPEVSFSVDGVPCAEVAFVDDDRLNRLRAKSDVERQSTEDYYRMAQDYGRVHENFPTLKEGIIWGLHARAVPMALIGKIVRKSPPTVYRVVRRHRLLAGLKPAAPELK